MLVLLLTQTPKGLLAKSNTQGNMYVSYTQTILDFFTFSIALMRQCATVHADQRPAVRIRTLLLTVQVFIPFRARKVRRQVVFLCKEKYR